MPTITLRRWQKSALDAFLNRQSPDFLAVATPGAGKTTFALAAAAQDLAANPDRRLVVVAPTAHLKTQWTMAAERLGLHLADGWSRAQGRLPADMHGVAVTYQQIGADPTPFAAAASRAFVILDEVHHAGGDKSWGEGIATAFATSPRRLSLSGTPFRSDDSPIPFVTYQDDTAVADYTYGYSDALADSVVRPVRFPRVGGQMEWIDTNGNARSHSFDDELETADANQRLRTALSPSGQWLPAVLTSAHRRLMKLRAKHPDAGGLVICMDQTHARAIAKMLRELSGKPAAIALSDDPGASGVIDRFSRSNAEWIVAVRMISEGVDIPRLRVGVFATNTTTELFFRQAVGRLVRTTGDQDDAYMFLPDDVRLRTFASRLDAEITHRLRGKEADGEQLPDGDYPEQDLIDEANQLLTEPSPSQYAAISAVATGGVTTVAGGPGPAMGRPTQPAGADDANALTVQLQVPTLGGSGPDAAAGQDAGSGAPTVTRAERKRELRDANSQATAELVWLSELPHRQVNAELNRRVGVARITEATVEQLEQRLAAADAWMVELAQQPVARF